MNEVMNSVNNVIMDNFHKTDNILNDVQTIIEVSQKEAYRSVNTILSQRNWLIGYRIAVEELAGEERAEYGVEIIKNLSRYLTQKYGKGYDSGINLQKTVDNTVIRWYSQMVVKKQVEYPLSPKRNRAT